MVAQGNTAFLHYRILDNLLGLHLTLSVELFCGINQKLLRNLIILMRQSGGPNCLLIGTSFTLLAGTRCEKDASSSVDDDVERCSSLFRYLWIK